jgi:hypothetical protein
MKRAENEGRLIDLKVFRDTLTDVLTQVVAFIRHSHLPEAEKKQLITSVTTFEYEPGGKVGAL